MIQLKRPSIELLPSYLAFMDAMKRNGDKIWELNLPMGSETDVQFVERVLRSEIEPLPGLVPETLLWATLENTVVGKIGLRHHLTDALREFGGNIGYEVHPDYRRRGIATEMLKQLLTMPKTREIGKLLLTCAPDNIGSIKTILSNGGILERTAYVPKWERDTSYYWITVSQG